MTKYNVDRDSVDPVYYQIAMSIHNRIESGEITKRAPSETEIQRDYGVARPTATKAIQLLRSVGIVKSVQGHGTFVVKADD